MHTINHDSRYLFTSDRLGFRTWTHSDLSLMLAINSNEKVMEFFPKQFNEKETLEFINRMQSQFNTNKLCYFAVEIIKTKEFIGFIGLSQQSYPSPFTPCIDIGWRINEPYWNQGYATEGAKACLHYAFYTLNIKEVFAVCPKINYKSEQVMKKIGMHKLLEFKHVYLKNNSLLETCVCYHIKNHHLI